MAPKLVLALDLETPTQVGKILQKVSGWIDYYKIGYKLYFRSGPRIVKFLKNRGERVFLDLKLFDIPSIVESACSHFVKMKVDIFNLHTLGGYEMMRKVKEAVQREGEKVNSFPLIFGVTILTSMDEEICRNAFGIKGNFNLQEKVIYLATIAKRAGLDGVIASPFEISAIKRECGKDFLVMCPGIRVPTSSVAKDDQKRFLTPGEAKEKGADFLVIGRPILFAPDPIEVIELIKKDIA
ncbi:MAG: orotidine-5'-phosphate decarboxylase [candidate division WOR-3 bacterium]